MRGSSRTFSAVCLSFLMVGSFGAVPVLAVASAGSSPSGGDSLLAAASDVAGYLRSLERWDGSQANIHPAIGLADRPIEVIVEIQGRSLAAEQSYRIQRGLPLLDGPAQKAYVAGLRASHADVRATLAASGATVRYDYAVVYNGVTGVADQATLYRIAALPGVLRIQRTQLATLALDNSVPYILGGMSYEELDADGTGVRIAVIDSGIDYTHAALGGSGDPDDYSENDPKVKEAGTFPTAKVVGGTDFVGENYDARGSTAPGGACSATPAPDSDPLDINGHGTHSASTAAGLTVLGDGGTVLTPHGVAPGASLLAVKIFSGCASDGTASTSTANVVAAIEWAMDPDGDGDTSDRVDVINMSLGGAFGRDTEASSVASNAAVDLGAIVVASAGNAGNIPYITGSPAAASRAISVAAGNDPGIKVQLLAVAATAGGTADGSYESIEAAFAPPVTTTGLRSGLTAFVGDACAAFPSGSLAGRIPLIIRGTCLFVDKVANVQDAGAVGAVVFNNLAGGEAFVMGGTKPGFTFTIPAVMVNNADGTKIMGALAAGTTFTLDPANQLPIPNRLASFTSRGPRFNDAALKPDVTAPGVAVLSAEVGTGMESTPVSGTSFSAPHVAGSAAILRELHPDWTVEEIKALMMNTAADARPDGSAPYPTALMGAGRVRVDVAAAMESVVVPGSASFGVEERSAAGVQQFDVSLAVRNLGTASKTFSLSSAFRVPSEAAGISLVHPSTLTVGAGASMAFALSLRVDFAALGGSLFEKDGFLILTETTSGGDALRVPFHVIPIARAAAHALSSDVSLASPTFMVRNDGIRPTRVDVFQAGAEDPNEDLIVEPEGMPQDPDDWFDIRATGLRSFGILPVSSHADQILEFGVAVWGRRSAPNFLMTDIVINVDGGAPDYLVEVADLGLFTTGSFDGRMASAVFALQPRPGATTGLLEFIVPNTLNAAWQSAPVFLADLNALARENNGPKIGLANERFTYVVITTDLETGSFDISGSGVFNAKAVELDAFPNVILSLAAGATASIKVIGEREGGLLLVYRSNVAGPSQSEVVTISD